ncbi:hypothetical protein PC116_g2651 [Phytophthora cactorum]|nr:hypothetical protein PC114_g1290 [Phytophthora cactorum]KAG3205283.1 hypothetical protein PC128_g1446 [Phytophthora cactorum]KAG4249695.1 hypothetical protein PC116_g2651 [Phytophthora cactorum]
MKEVCQQQGEQEAASWKRPFHRRLQFSRRVMARAHGRKTTAAMARMHLKAQGPGW